MDRRLFASVLSLMWMPAFAQTPRATIYFIPWEVLVRAALNADDVRRRPYVIVTLVDRSLVESLLESINQLPESRDQSEVVQDVRLVLEIEMLEGAKRVLVADNFRLLDTTTKGIRKLDQRFRNRFSALVGR